VRITIQKQKLKRIVPPALVNQNLLDEKGRITLHLSHTQQGQVFGQGSDDWLTAWETKNER